MYAMVSRDIAPISLNYGRFRSIWGKKICRNENREVYVTFNDNTFFFFFF